jgi:hypothetical protein
MSLFGPFVYKTKSGQKFYLHMKEKGKVTLYYFSKDMVGALNSLPKGYEVTENPKVSLPFLKKKAGGGLFGGGKKKDEKNPKQESTPAENTSNTK